MTNTNEPRLDQLRLTLAQSELDLADLQQRQTQLRHKFQTAAQMLEAHIAVCDEILMWATHEVSQQDFDLDEVMDIERGLQDQLIQLREREQRRLNDLEHDAQVLARQCAVTRWQIQLIQAREALA